MPNNNVRAAAEGLPKDTRPVDTVLDVARIQSLLVVCALAISESHTLNNEHSERAQEHIRTVLEFGADFTDGILIQVERALAGKGGAA